MIVMTACAPSSEKAPKAWINDHANLLTEQEADYLAQVAMSLEDSVGSQMVVLTIDSLNGESIEELARRTANEWGIGRAEYNDGVLIAIAVRERRVRIEVGKGLEKILPDQMAARIISEDVVPQFRTERYFEGLLACMQRIKRMIILHADRIGKE